VVLGGCSMGGYLAMAVLRLAPERVGGLVLIDTKAAPDTPEAAQSRLDVAERVAAEGIGGWLAEANLPTLLAESTRKERPDVVETVREIIESQPPAGISWTALALRTRPDSFELLRESGVPALVVVGEEDPITPVEAASAMAEALPGSTLVVLPGAGHLTPLEVPAEVVEAVLSWYPATHEK
jgi:pimeloyl-ACP methyl ester carboxylesterase